jgi:nicotinamidase-related amidase
MSRALLLIDIQRDYFPGGAFELVGPDAAATSARDVLERFRSGREPIIHVRHAASAPAPFLVAGTPGAEIDDRVAPAGGEPVIVKQHPNAFRATSLEQLLREQGISELVVGGMMTSMCVDASVRAAADLGFAITVVGDACAAPALSRGSVTVPGEQVHTAFLAALDGTYATVVDAADLD